MIKIKRGLDLPIDGKPDPSIKDPIKVTKVAVVGVDFPGLKPTMLVEVGDKVKKGQPLFEDKKNPGVLFTAPEAGTVAEINRGEKRAFLSLVIETDPSLGAEKFKSYESKEIEKLSKEDVQDQLIKSGAWVYLKTRPFAKTPKIGSEPNAIFVTAMDTNPLAPDAALIIKDNEKAFLDGIAVMSRLAKTVYVCKGEGSLPLSNISNVKEETFVGPHPAGLAGTHMHFLEGASLNNMLWYINYQDVIAIGKLFSTGELYNTRFISIAGPGIKEPKIVPTCKGACVSELVAGNLNEGEQRVVSGSVLYGRKAEGAFDYLGCFTNQVTALPEGRQQEFMGWVRPGFKKFSISRTFVGPFIAKKFKFDTGVNGGKRAIIPFYSFERIMPMDIIPSLLLRSLAILDTDEAQNLGCLELDEEDLALCTYVDPCKGDFGPLLRRCLDKIELEG